MGSGPLIVKSQFERLVDRGIYAFNADLLDSAEELKATITSKVRAHADFSFAAELSKSKGVKVSFVGNDIQMYNSIGQPFCDVDSLFKTDDNSTYILLERKTTIRGTASITKQMAQTKAQFVQQLMSNQTFRNHFNLADPMGLQPHIEEGVFFEAGSAEDIQSLTAAGFNVLTDATSFFKAGGRSLSRGCWFGLLCSSINEPTALNGAGTNCRCV